MALVGAVPVLAGIRGSDEHAIKLWGLAGHDRRRRRSRARRIPHAAVQLAQHLPAASAARRHRARRGVRPARARGGAAAAPRTPRQDRDRQHRLPRALRRARGRAVPLGAAARRGVGMVADRGRDRRDDVAGRARSPCAGCCPGSRNASRSAVGGVALAGGLVALGFLPASTRGVGRARARARAASASDCSAACSRRRPFRRANPARARRRSASRRATPGFVLALAVIAPGARRQPQHGRTHRDEGDDRRGARLVACPCARRCRSRSTSATSSPTRPAARCPIPRCRSTSAAPQTDEKLRETRDGVVAAIKDTLTRGFRSSFLIAALFAVVAAIAAALLGVTRASCRATAARS